MDRVVRAGLRRLSSAPSGKWCTHEVPVAARIDMHARVGPPAGSKHEARGPRRRCQDRLRRGFRSELVLSRIVEQARSAYVLGPVGITRPRLCPPPGGTRATVRPAMAASRSVPSQVSEERRVAARCRRREVSPAGMPAAWNRRPDASGDSPANTATRPRPPSSSCARVGLTGARRSRASGSGGWPHRTGKRHTPSGSRGCVPAGCATGVD